MRITGPLVEALLSDFVPFESRFLTEAVDHEDSLVEPMPRIANTGHVEAGSGQDDWNACAQDTQPAELIGFFDRIETIVVLESNEAMRCDNTEDRDQEEEDTDRAASDVWIDDTRKYTDGRLAPACGEQVLDEDAAHADIEVLLHEVDK